MNIKKLLAIAGIALGTCQTIPGKVTKIEEQGTIWYCHGNTRASWHPRDGYHAVTSYQKEETVKPHFCVIRSKYSPFPGAVFRDLASRYEKQEATTSQKQYK